MGFSTDMLDGFDVLYKRTEGSLKVSSDMATFFKKLAIIEADHAKLLVKLSANYGTKKLLANPHIDGTVREAWATIFRCVDTVAAKQENFAHSLMKEVSLAMSDFVKEREVVRKKLSADGQKLTKDMKNQLDTLSKVRSNYLKASKESESAMVAVNKEISGSNQPKKVAQLQQKASQAAEKAATSDQEYKDVLKTTNTKQQDYYHSEMPHLLNEFQQFEEERINFTKTMLTKYANLLLEMPPVYLQTSEDVSKEASKMDASLDVNRFTNENKTGVTPPPPIEYQSYEINAAIPNLPDRGSLSPSRMGSFMVKSTVSADREWGLTKADESLTVEQKRSKLEQQLIDLDAHIRSETTAKNGVEKLVQFYANDPAAQRKAESELADAEKKIKTLQDHKQNVKTLLTELNGGVPPAENGHPEPTEGVEEKTVLVKVRGLFDYVATCDTELSFKEGDILTITEQDESGWWYAEVDGRAGFVPQNYVEVTE
eukprot:Phypoly_transcript_06134.p1 GENE.Phypoly_transcript_06134~~Phypoly_transcript_06134.p1  ORF type:complete len:485 (+),score=114.94 Phypoly_transcript_06134:175-1629(+)